MARRSAWKVALFAAAAFAAGVGSSGPDGSVMAAGSAGRAPIRSNAAFVHRHQNQNAPTFGRRCWRGAGRKFGAAWHQSDLGSAPLFATLSAGGDPVSAYDGCRDQPPLSEMDAIRILRATPRYGTGGQRPEEMRACRTAVDVLHILGRASPIYFDAGEMSSMPNLDSERLAATVGKLAGSVSPNVAAAALRRLSSPPFLPGPGAGRRSRRFLHRGLNASSTERRAYDGLMKRILDRLASTMERQQEYLSSATVQRDSVNATLLQQKDTWVEPPSSEAHALNWYALADLLQSLSSLCRVLGQRGQGGNIIQAHLLTNISPQEQESMVELFDGIVGYLSWDDTMATSFVRCVGPRRLVRDVVQPLASMARSRKKMERRDEKKWAIINDDEDGATSPDRSDQLLATVSVYLALPHSLDKLTAFDLSTTLQSFARIYGRRGDAFGKQSLMQNRQRLLIRAFMKRLRKSSVRASDDGKGLVQAVRAVARIIGYLEEQAETVQPVSTPKVLPMSISLPGEDGNDAPAFALPLGKDTKTAVSNQRTCPSDGADIPIETLREEAVIMLHTIINDIVHPSKIPVRDGSKSGNVETKLQSLGLGRIADLLHAATTLDPRGLDPATVSTILRHLTLEGVLQQCRSCKDISRLLLSLQRLRVGTGTYGELSECNGAKHAETEGLEEQCVRLLGERFFGVVAWHQENSKRPGCNAKALTTALRSVVLMFPNNAAATMAMLDAAKMLVLEEADYDASDVEDWDSSTFLSSCNDFELSNLMFAFAMAKRFDEDVFVALTDQMMEEYILESCSASSASRAMWSCAMLLSLEEVASKTESDFAAPDGSYLKERQVDMFHQLAPQLLFSPLSPTDASCAMWAWAKMDYAIDRGIFDTLAESLATEGMLRRATTRLVSQALWACAKMAEFDSFESDGELPPYVKCVDKYLRFLVANQAQMTPKHISQTIWAIGRLHAYFALDQGGGHAYIDAMGKIARGKAKHLNAREVANCVWGLSNYDQPECILGLINHIVSSQEHTAKCTAQEAATLLFVLGKLNVHDREAFACLSEVLVDRMHEADSQTIANALWAHDVVGIAAPPELLSSFVQTKLGLGTAVLGDSNVMD